VTLNLLGDLTNSLHDYDRESQNTFSAMDQKIADYRQAKQSGDSYVIQQSNSIVEIRQTQGKLTSSQA
jgi:hypothetical protein